MNTKSFKTVALLMMIALMVAVARGQSVYSNAVMNLNPAAYWPLQETTQPPAADIETNWGTLGPIANAIYASEGGTNTTKGFTGIPASGDSAISFPGNNLSFMIVPTTDNRVSLPAGGAFSVEAWVYPIANQQFVSFASQTGPIGSGGNNAGANSAGWSLNEDWLPFKGTATGNNSLHGFSFHVFNGVGSTGGAEADASYDFSLNTWYHIVGVFDGVNCFIYVNGVNVTSYQIAMTGSFVPDSWDPIEFGCNRGLGANPYHGGLAEVAIYSSAISTNQIINDYNVGVGITSANYFTTVQGNSPLMYWRMDAPGYTPPATSTYPNAGNYGSLAASITNYNTLGHSAVYQPGAVPGVAGPMLSGFGSFTNACAFNGIVGGVDAGYESALDPTGDTNAFTVVGWFKSNPADNNSRFNSLASHSDSSWRFKMQNGNSQWNYGGAASPQQAISPATDNVNDGNWHMFAGIYDTTNVTEIIDGYVSSSSATTNNIAGKATMDAFLGAAPDFQQPGNNNYNTAQQYFAGRLAHVAFFTKALTGSQIANLYTSATGGATPPPTITAQPFPYPSVRTVSGGAGTFIFEAVIAQGTPNLAYQWYFNTSSNYVGATALVDNITEYTNSQTSQVTITNLSAANSGYYFCIVTNNYGATTSAIVDVQVQMSPVITAQSPGGPFSLFPDQNTTLSVTAIGAAPTYQWYTNGVADTTAGTASTYNLTGAQPAMNGFTYQCVVGNGSGSATGAVDTLTMLAFPASIASSPYSTNILGLNPSAYWPMHETEAQPYIGDIETNYGSLGALGNGYYQDWNTPVVTHNIPGAIAGSSDTAVEFYNANNDAMIVPHTSPKVTIAGPYTLEAWIKPEADNSGGVGSYMVIMGQGGGGGLDNGGGRAGFALQYSGTADTFSLVIWTNAANANNYEQKTVVGYPPGVWYYLVCTYDGTNVAYYVNDQLAAFGASQSGFPSQMLPDTWSPFTIGAGRWGNGGCSQPFIGAMDEVAVYTNLLTTTQIQNHYSAGTNAASNYFQTVQNDSPYLYYHMDAPPYVAPPTNNWPVLTNYGSAAFNGKYVPSTIPGGVFGPNYPGLGGTNAMAGNQVSAYADAGVYPSINPLNVTVPFSCTFWFKGNPADNRWNGIMAGNDADWRCLLNPSGQVQGHGNADTASPTINNDGLWHQFVLTYQPSNGLAGFGGNLQGQNFGTNNVYVDGLLVKSSVGGNSNNPSSDPGPDVLLGNEFGNHDPVTSSGGRSLDGAMCEAAFFYGTVLSPVQIRGLYDAAAVKAFIATQPRSLSVNQNSAFTNTAAGDGSDPLVYQWYFNTTSNYSGATKMTDNGRITGTATAALGDSSAAIGDGGYYYVIVTNNYGYATSSIVSLVVNSSIVITNSAPIPYTNIFALYTGVSPTFSLGAAGAGPIIYRWYTNGVLVAGANNSSFIWNGVHGTNVYCIASNVFNTATNSWTWNLLPTNGLPTFPQAALALNPSGYWRLNEIPDDGNGDFGVICHDYAGGNDGVYTNAYLAQQGYNPTQDPTDTSCYFGAFATPNSLVGGIRNVDFSQPLGSNAEFTVEAWVNPQFTPTANTPCIAAKGYYFQEQFDLDAGAGAAKAFRFECRPINGTEIDAFASWGLTNFSTLNQWYHLVGVCDEANGQTHLYINGALAGTGTIPVGGGLTNALGTAMEIGCRAQNATASQTEQFPGYINDVAVYPFAMTASQVVNEYQWPPSITQQPVSSTNVDQGGVLTVAAAASGTAPLSYEWYDQNAGHYIPGQTNATLVISNIPASDTYYLTVNNPYGTTNSQTVAVTVISGLTVNPLVPSSRSLYVGQMAPYTISASGTVPIYYQWSTNGVAITSGTNSTVAFIVPPGNSSVSCVVSNAYNGYTAVTEGPVTLTGVTSPTNVYAKAVLNDHPIAFWRLNEPDDNLNDGNPNTIANDYVGGHNGTYANTLLGAPGYNPVLDPATAAEFGTNGVVNSEVTENTNTIDGVANLDFSEPIGSNAEFSVEAWANGPSSEPTNSGIVSIGTWGNEQFTIDTGGTPPGNSYRLSLRDGGNNIHNAVSPVVPDGSWHHLVGVCDAASSNVLMYVDGVLQGTSGNDLTPGLGLRTRLTPLMIGQRPGPAAQPSEQFIGTIADVALYNYALTATQVADHYQLGTIGTLVNLNPTNIVVSLTGGTNLTLTWPLDHIGWTLQAQTNSVHVGLSNNWVNVANSTGTNQLVMPINKNNGTVFYRLIYR